MSVSEIRSQYQEMVKYGESILTQKFTVPQFTKLIRELVGTTDIKVKTSRDKTVLKNHIVVNGDYDQENDESNLPPITIYITYNSSQKKIAIKDINWPKLCLDLIECTGHEIIHQTQYRLRGFDIGPHIFVSLSPEEGKRREQEYLGNADEVEAYGYSIAIEILINDYPKKITNKYIVKTEMYKCYENAFGREHKVVKQLLLFVIKYYEALSEDNHERRLQEVE